MLLFRGMTVLARAVAAPQCLKGYSACGQGLPANFCCSPGSKCIVLASNTTALCCPNGQTCNAITPTTCDVGLMNVAGHPGSPILTTALDSDLSSCGNSTCCPLGYECASRSDGAPYCAMAKNQAAYTSLVSQKTKAAISTASASTTAHTSTTATATADSTRTTTLQSFTDTAAANATARAETGAAARSAGVIAGSVIAAIVVFVGIGLFFWVKRRKLPDHSRSKPAPVRSMHQHEGPYQAPAYDIPRTEISKKLQPNPATFCEALTTSPAYVAVTAFEDLDGSKASHSECSGIQTAQSPVELPASPVSFSMWEKQQQTRTSVRELIKAFLKPPRAQFLPLSRSAAAQGRGPHEDGGNWI